MDYAKSIIHRYGTRKYKEEVRNGAEVVQGAREQKTMFLRNIHK